MGMRSTGPAGEPSEQAASAPLAKSPKDQLKDAQRLAIQGKYRAAVQAFEKVRAEKADAIEGIDGIHFATAYAALDDRVAHERLCRWLLDRFDETSSPMDAYRAAKSYVLYPGVDDEELLAKSLKLTQYALDESTGGVLPWFYVAHGMANYRLERYAEAGSWLNKSIGHNEPKIRSLALAYSALVELGQGNEVSARDFLAQAKQAVAQIREQDWRDAEITNLALREAETLFGTAAAQTSAVTKTVQYLPADNLDAFTVFMRGHGAGNDPNGAFRLVDGVLVASGAEAGMLFTNEEYENYRLEVEYKWLSDRDDRDSGIFVNILGRDGAEQMPSADMRAIEVNILGPTPTKPDRLSGQIWLFSPNGDTVNLTVDGKVYTKRKTASVPPEDFENPNGEWNTMVIRSAKGKFLVTLNGKVAVEASDPVPSRGKIALQSSRGEIHFGRMIVTNLD